MTTTTKLKQQKGFAVMSVDARRKIASAGGKAAHAQGKAHKYNSETGRAAGQKSLAVRAAAASAK